MESLVPPDMGILNGFIEVLCPQGFPPVMIAQQGHPFPRNIREHIRTAIVHKNRKGFQNYDLGALVPERTAQILLRLVKLLSGRPAHIGGNALFFPDFHRDKAAVAFAVSEKQNINGIFRLSQKAVGLGCQHACLSGVIFGQHNVGGRRYQNQQDQKETDPGQYFLSQSSPPRNLLMSKTNGCRENCFLRFHV